MAKKVAKKKPVKKSPAYSTTTTTVEPSASQLKTKYVFKLLRGVHEDSSGRHKKGSYIFTNQELDKMMGSEKFQRLREDEIQLMLERQKARSGEDNGEEEDSAPLEGFEGSDDTFDVMGEAELRELADEEEIDISSANSVEEIRELIRKS